MHNFGGFTDGDRAVCLAINLGVPIKKITLLGFSTTRLGNGLVKQTQKKNGKIRLDVENFTIIGLEQQVATNAYVEPDLA